jgi:hypothetical protein
MNDVIFNRGEGGLGRALAGEDHISGILAYLPVNSNQGLQLIADQVKVIYSIQEAEAIGIGNKENFPEYLKRLHYQINSVFQANKKAVLYLAIYASDGIEEPDYSKVLDIQRFAEGKIRQLGIMNEEIDFDSSMVTILQEQADVLEAEHKPLSIVLAGKMSSFSNLSTLPELRNLDAKNVSVVIGQDGAGLGIELNTSILGLTIGFLSLAKVNENIGWVGRFNVAKNATNEFDVPALSTDGTLLKTISEGAIEAINSKGYIFIKKHVGTAGTYFNDSPTSTDTASDYAFIENNRTIDKAVRSCRKFLLPSLNAPLYVNENGTLTEDTIASFRNDARRGLEVMQKDGEVSTFEVEINPSQDVISSSKIVLSLKIVPVGVARKIEVNIGFAVKIS